MTQLILCIDSPGFGGAEIDLMRMINMVDKQNLLVFCNKDCNKELVKFFKSKNFKIKSHFIKSSKWFFIIGVYNSLKIIIRNFNTTYIIWAHHSDSNRWLQFTLALLKRKFIIVERAGAPNFTSLKRSRLTKPIKKLVLRNAFKVVYCGKGIMDDYIRVLNIKDKTNLQIIPNTRDINAIYSQVLGLRLRSNYDGLKRSYNILTVSRLDDQKGVEVLLESVYLLNKKFLPITISIVGDGPCRLKLEDIVKKYRINNVTFYGTVLSIIPFLAFADIFVFPSLFEGLPGALIEAMAAKLPCVASNIAGNNELVIDGITGLLVPPDNVMALANTIEMLLTDKNLSNKLAENGFRQVLNNYNENVERDAWLKLIKDIL